MRLPLRSSKLLIAESRRTSDRKVAKDQVWDDYKYEWRAQLGLNEKVLLDETNKFESAGKGTLSRPFTLTLTPGYYAVQIVTWSRDGWAAAAGAGRTGVPGRELFRLGTFTYTPTVFSMMNGRAE